MATTGFATLWEFAVKASRREEFESHYGPDGSWVRLFRKAPGYVATDLLNDRDNPLRYVTIDRWSSVEHWREFRQRHAQEYEALDRECEGLTTHEAPLGEYSGR
ncbi:MAG TPA: antibiotic biosynthesis monooxygenase [Steroidobacteraceae bacterium]